MTAQILLVTVQSDVIAELLLIKILVEKTVFRYLGKNIGEQFLRLPTANPAARSGKRHRNAGL